MLSSNPVALPPEAGDPPGGQGTGFRCVQGVPLTSQVRSPRHIIEMIFATSSASMLAADEDANAQGFLYLLTAAPTR